jgi:hypothetical protein
MKKLLTALCLALVFTTMPTEAKSTPKCKTAQKCKQHKMLKGHKVPVLSKKK